MNRSRLGGPRAGLSPGASRPAGHGASRTRGRPPRGSRGFPPPPALTGERPPPQPSLQDTVGPNKDLQERRSGPPS